MQLSASMLLSLSMAVASVPAAAISSDGGGVPWAVVNKRSATLQVFRADGSLAGETNVLLGADPGDAVVPGVGERTQSRRLRAGDRTTPAGRFVSSPGINQAGEAVVWLDYEAAFAIHRLRGGTSHSARQQLMQNSDPARRRVSAGCVVVPVVFFETIVQPLLGRGGAVVWVLPES